MVQNVTIPLAWSNNIPGVSGISDVSFDVPQTDDIADEIDDTLPSLGEIRTAVREELDEAIDELDTAADVLPGDFQQSIDDAVQSAFSEAIDITGQIDVDLGGIVQDAVLEALDVDEGLFGPLDSPIDDAFEAAVTAALDDLEELDIGLPGIEDRLYSLQQALEDIPTDAPDVDIPDIREEVRGAIEGLPGGTLLTDPDQFIDDQIDRVTDGLVDDDARQELEDALGGDS